MPFANPSHSTVHDRRRKIVRFSSPRRQYHAQVTAVHPGDHVLCLHSPGPASLRAQIDSSRSLHENRRFGYMVTLITMHKFVTFSARTHLNRGLRPPKFTSVLRRPSPASPYIWFCPHCSISGGDRTTEGKNTPVSAHVHRSSQEHSHLHRTLKQ